MVSGFSPINRIYLSADGSDGGFPSVDSTWQNNLSSLFEKAVDSFSSDSAYHLKKNGVMLLSTFGSLQGQGDIMFNKNDELIERRLAFVAEICNKVLSEMFFEKTGLDEINSILSKHMALVSLVAAKLPGSYWDKKNEKPLIQHIVLLKELPRNRAFTAQKQAFKISVYENLIGRLSEMGTEDFENVNFIPNWLTSMLKILDFNS